MSDPMACLLGVYRITIACDPIACLWESTVLPLLVIRVHAIATLRTQERMCDHAYSTLSGAHRLSYCTYLTLAVDHPLSLSSGDPCTQDSLIPCGFCHLQPFWLGSGNHGVTEVSEGDPMIAVATL